LFKDYRKNGNRHAPMVSAAMRLQFAAIKDRFDAHSVLQPLNLAVSNPPTQLEVQAIADRLDQVIVALQGG
jgi:hypothetical protein